MATIDIGKSSGREVNRELALVPFIDFLLCLVSFLLITAVWSQQARLESDAQVPGVVDVPRSEQPKRLHVGVRDRKFELTWKQGETVLARDTIERRAISEHGEIRYPDLAQRITREWRQAGMHKAASDPKRDEVVLSTANDLEFGELAAVLDAIAAPKRERQRRGQVVHEPAFAVTFAVN